MYVVGTASTCPGIGRSKRQIQTAEKTFFNDFELGDIPVVAVFTHFDEVKEKHQFKLGQQFKRNNPGKLSPDQALSDQADAYAVRDYENIYRRNLEKIIGKHSRIAIQYVAMAPEDDLTTSYCRLLLNSDIGLVFH